MTDIMCNETAIHFMSEVDFLKECQLVTSSEATTKLFKYLPIHKAVTTAPNPTIATTLNCRAITKKIRISIGNVSLSIMYILLGI